MTTIRFFLFLLLLLGLAALAYLSLRPSPWIEEVVWVPSSISRWADRHGILRNTAAFFVFGLFVFAFLGRRWFHAAALCLFATAIEVAQLWIPHRAYDPKDIAAGVAGILAAWLLVCGVCRIVRPRRA